MHLDEHDALPEGPTLLTPLSQKRFHITDVQEHRVIVEFDANHDTKPLQRDQFDSKT